MLRRAKGAPSETVLDPNTWASDEVLALAVPSTDGRWSRSGRPWAAPTRCASDAPIALPLLEVMGATTLPLSSYV
jgi:hypothetical protein